VNSRDDQMRLNFRKYGEVPRMAAGVISDHLYQSSRHANTIATQSSVMSSIQRHRMGQNRDVTDESLKDELNKLYSEPTGTPIDV